MRWLVTDTGRPESLRHYLDWLGRAGIAAEVAAAGRGVPTDYRDHAALLLTGGGDMDPRLFKEDSHPATCEVQPERDRFELDLVGIFLKRQRPVLGICRGLQVINVALGGKLIQHLGPGILERHRGAGEVFHPIRLRGSSGLARALERAELVNSTHHQALDPMALGMGLEIVAVSDDGVIEAAAGQHAGTEISAVQWHPERLEPRASPPAAGLLRFWKELAVEAEGAAQARIMDGMKRT